MFGTIVQWWLSKLALVFVPLLTTLVYLADNLGLNLVLVNAGVNAGFLSWLDDPELSRAPKIIYFTIAWEIVPLRVKMDKAVIAK